MSAQGEAGSPLTRLGRYELITRIGQGGMAEVQLALQRGPAGFEKLVVVKLVHESLATQKAFVDMLLDEARVAALVKHPNVVDIYDLGQADGRFFIAMEYLEGEPLLAVLRAGREGKRLDALSTGRLIADTAEGLDAAHELRSMSGEPLELVHHDISLGNIVVLYNGQVKLVDFGVAKASQSASRGAKVQGKFSYMAPEKLKGAQGDRRSDIFSLGCVMWEALTLKRLFRGGNDGETMKQVLEMAIQAPSKINGDVPADFDPIVLRALDRDPARRHGTAKELAVELEEALRNRGYGAKNDRVARYMQDTFRSHIDARKKLVQEVVAKGVASAEVLDAAFSDAVLASGSPITPPQGVSEFSLKYPAGTPSVPAVTNQFADASSATVISQSPFVDLDKPTEIGTPPIAGRRGRAQDLARTLWVRSRSLARTGVERGRALARTGVERGRALTREVLADRKRRRIAAVVGGVMLLIIVVAIGRSGGGGEPATHPAPAPDVAKPIAPPAPPPRPPAVVVPEPAGSAAVVTPPPIVDDHHVTEHPTRPKPPVVDKPNPEALFKQGVQAFVKGDAKTALGLLQKAKAANPSYAPTWRVLGQVYEKLGDRGAAKAAFQRYLALAPSAADAPTVRDRLEHL